MERGGGENGMNSLLSHSHSQMSLEAEDHHRHHQHHHDHQNGHNFGDETQNDLFEQILSSGIPNWPVSDNPKSGDSPSDGPDGFRHQINGASAAVKSMLLQQQQQLHSALLPLPLSLGTPPDSVDPSPFKSQGGGDAAVQALFNGFTGSLPSQQQHFHPGSAQNYGGQAGAGVMNQGPPTSASAGGGGSNGAASQKQNKPRARRGQATDPHSIAERLRRERIAERMKALQELVPNANKTDKASMLDEIIDYVKFLQLQVKVLSMSRLGGAGAGAVAPLVADRASEGGRGGGNPKQAPGASSTNEQSSMTVTEHQVAKLMEEDMGSAMQYLQGKGLCLMPISLATAISTATCHSRNPLPPTLTRAALLNNLTNNGNHNLDNTTNNNNGNNGNDPASSNSNILPPPSSPTLSRD